MHDANMKNFGKETFMLLFCMAAFAGAEERQNSTLNPVKYDESCFWTTVGGNLTSAKQSCNEDGGAIFSFNNTSDAISILDKLNITHATPVFIGAIRNHDNGSWYFDWLSRAGTWSDDLSVEVAGEEEAVSNSDSICIKLLQKCLFLTNCSEIMPVTVCENNNIQNCSLDTSVALIDAERRSDPVEVGADTPEQPEETSQNDSSASHPAKRVTTTTMPHITIYNDEQTSNAKGVCPSETCPYPLNTLISSQTTDAATTQHGEVSTQQTTESTSRNAVDLKGGELVILPSENGTRITNFSTLLSEIVEKSNISKPPDPTPILPSPVVIAGPNMSGNSTDKKHSNITTGTLVKEVPFQVANKDRIFNGGVQVSGLNGGSVQPYSPLLIDQHVPLHRTSQLVNTSRILKTLKQEKDADNTTLMVFADTVQVTANDKHISEESDDLKMDLFSDIMCVGENLVMKIPVSIAEVTVTTDTIVLFSKILKHEPSDSKMHLEVDHPHTDTHIQLSNSIFGSDVETNVRVSTIAYREMGVFSKASNKHISSPVVSVTVQYIKGNTSEEARMEMESVIKFEMKTEVDRGKQEDKRQCTFWNFSERRWSSSGCAVVSKNVTHTTCECNHLTNFAILVMYIETENISLQNQQALFTLTTVGCSLSIACLAMTLICYIYLKMLCKEKIMIHANLSTALLLGQIVFVASGDAHRDPIACKVVAILLHFLFMASFTWMMVEGIALYLCCTKGIFHHRDMRVKYFLVGWGLPVVVIVISLAARFPEYGRGPQYSCWLSINHGLIWAFLGPMVFIVVMNIGVMGLVIKCFLTLQANSEKTEVARLRGSLRAMMTLLPLLGVSWILSLLVPFSVVFHYFFVIFNTLQGMCIFFLHCICNEEIRKKFYEKRRRWSTTRTGSDAEMTFPSRRKTGSFDAIRAAATATPLPAEYASRTAWT